MERVVALAIVGEEDEADGFINGQGTILGSVSERGRRPAEVEDGVGSSMDRSACGDAGPVLVIRTVEALIQVIKQGESIPVEDTGLKLDSSAGLTGNGNASWLSADKFVEDFVSFLQHEANLFFSSQKSAATTRRALIKKQEPHLPARDVSMSSSDKQADYLECFPALGVGEAARHSTIAPAVPESSEKLQPNSAKDEDILEEDTDIDIYIRNKPKNRSPLKPRRQSSFGERNLSSPAPMASELSKFGSATIQPPKFALAATSSLSATLLSPAQRRRVAQMARLYSTLILEGCVRCMMDQVGFLFECLEQLERRFREEEEEGGEGEEEKHIRDKTQSGKEEGDDELSKEKSDKPQLLTNVLEPTWAHWTQFVCIVIQRLEPLWQSLGPAVCDLLVKFPVLQVHASMIVRRMAARQRETLGLSISAEDLSRNGNAGQTLGFSLPFRKDTDSRLHFRTRELTRLYANRESVRDNFLGALRSFRERRDALVPASSSSETLANEACKEAATACFSLLQTPNLYWFATLFVSELLQVCAIGGRDSAAKHDAKTISLLAKEDSRKLSKLHERFRQAPVGSSVGSSVSKANSAKGMGSSRKRDKNAGGKRGNKPKRVPLVSSLGQQTNGKRGWVGGKKEREMKCEHDGTVPISLSAFEAAHFLQDEAFFHIFIAACDSHKLNSILLTIMMAELHRLDDPSQVAISAKSNPSLWPQRVVAAQLLAKFSGLLVFGPNFYSSEEAFANGNSQALNSVLEDAMSALDESNATGFGPLGVLLGRLTRAAEHGTLSFTAAWVCSFLLVSKPDMVSRKSKGFASCLDLLAALSRRLGRSGANALFVAGQVEKLFIQLEEHRQTDDLIHLEKMNVTSPVIEDAVLHSSEFLRLAWPAAERLRAQLAHALAHGEYNKRQKKKIRPDSLNKRFGVDADDVGACASAENNANSIVAATGVDNTKDVGHPRDKAKSEELLREQLEASFLHQHPSIRAAVEFSVEALSQNALTQSIDDTCESGHVRQAVAEALDSASKGLPVAELEIVAQHKARASILQNLDRLRSQSMAIIAAAAAPGTPVAVIDTAAQVCLKRVHGRVKYLLPSKLPAAIQREIEAQQKAAMVAQAERSGAKRLHMQWIDPDFRASGDLSAALKGPTNANAQAVRAIGRAFFLEEPASSDDMAFRCPAGATLPEFVHLFATFAEAHGPESALSLLEGLAEDAGALSREDVIVEMCVELIRSLQPGLAGKGLTGAGADMGHYSSLFVLAGRLIVSAGARRDREFASRACERATAEAKKYSARLNSHHTWSFVSF